MWSAIHSFLQLNSTKFAYIENKWLMTTRVLWTEMRIANNRDNNSFQWCQITRKNSGEKGRGGITYIPRDKNTSLESQGNHIAA